MLINAIKKSQDFVSLKEEVEKGKLGKTLLFISKDSLYAEEFCKQVASLIFDGQDLEASENSMKVNANAHPDLKIFPTKERLLVPDSEEIVSECFVKPIFANKKVFIIRNIDEAMEVAQNKLLKVLEEPPANVYFLLTCSSVDKVLPTIRSRCVKTSLKKLDDNVILKLIESKTENSELVLAVCEGQIGKANKLSSKKDFAEICKASVEILTKLSSSKEVLAFSKKLQEFKDDFILIFDIISVALGDLLKIKAGRGNLIKLKPYEDDLNKASSGYTIRAICEISQLIDQVVKEKFYNVNTQLAIENFLLNVLEVKYLCK